jgi:hypothetical protein
MFAEAMRQVAIADARADRNMRVLMMFGTAMNTAIILLDSGRADAAKEVLKNALKGNKETLQ